MLRSPQKLHIKHSEWEWIDTIGRSNLLAQHITEGRTDMLTQYHPHLHVCFLDTYRHTSLCKTTSWHNVVPILNSMIQIWFQGTQSYQHIALRVDDTCVNFKNNNSSTYFISSKHKIFKKWMYSSIFSGKKVFIICRRTITWKHNTWEWMYALIWPFFYSK